LSPDSLLTEWGNGKSTGGALTAARRPYARAEDFHEARATAQVRVVEALETRAVDIEHPEDGFARRERNDDLGARRGIARDVAGKRVNVGNDERLALRSGCSANAASDRDPHAGRLALEGADDELLSSHEIEPRPIDIGQGIEEQGRGVCRVGNEIGLAREERGQIPRELGVCSVLAAEIVVLADVLHRARSVGVLAAGGVPGARTRASAC